LLGYFPEAAPLLDKVVHDSGFRSKTLRQETQGLARVLWPMVPLALSLRPENLDFCGSQIAHLISSLSNLLEIFLPCLFSHFLESSIAIEGTERNCIQAKRTCPPISELVPEINLKQARPLRFVASPRDSVFLQFT